MAVARTFGEVIPEESSVRVHHDDSIFRSTAAEKTQDIAEVGVTMAVWEYRQKWYGEDEKTARARADGLRNRAGTAVGSYEQLPNHSSSEA